MILKLNLLSIIILMFISCSLFTGRGRENPDYFSGTWKSQKNENATLTIILQKNDSYTLKAETEKDSWEGIGTRVGSKLLCIFRYVNSPDHGYVTYYFINNKKLRYESFNSDGSLRSEGYYIR
jgi:hypothetical protein